MVRKGQGEQVCQGKFRHGSPVREAGAACVPRPELSAESLPGPVWCLSPFNDDPDSWRKLPDPLRMRY
jgi:hypothetical protein